ncbi:hypothetical protein CUMW_203580 [Citrus unshiu]|uniref:Uncharacterized protein n=1 Tax=Citrus unshiu TaxID=55188 RepID=A0A2H5Q8P9_CITUN|nr:hypothetical protein CUMW_203580 [Citrus unshiu]
MNEKARVSFSSLRFVFLLYMSPFKGSRSEALRKLLLLGHFLSLSTSSPFIRDLRVLWTFEFKRGKLSLAVFCDAFKCSVSA